MVSSWITIFNIQILNSEALRVVTFIKKVVSSKLYFEDFQDLVQSEGENCTIVISECPYYLSNLYEK